MSETYFSNQQLADIFRRIGDLLEVKGEVIYKILAYRKAADSLENLGWDAYDFWRDGKLTEIQGVGKAIAEKMDELFSTGKLGFLEKLEQEEPPTIVQVLEVPDLGPKKAALFWKLKRLLPSLPHLPHTRQRNAPLSLSSATNAMPATGNGLGAGKECTGRLRHARYGARPRI